MRYGVCIRVNPHHNWEYNWYDNYIFEANDKLEAREKANKIVEELSNGDRKDLQYTIDHVYVD